MIDLILNRIVDVLYVVLVFTSIFQPTWRRRCAGLLFATVTVAHDAFLGDLAPNKGLAFYGTAALAYLNVLTLIVTFSFRDRVVHGIALICALSILGNAFGWIVWFVYWPPTVYNIIFVALYSAAAAILVWGIADGIKRGVAIYSWINRF